MFVAGAVTLAANVAVWLILAPLLNSWLRPGFDPSAWMFHLPAGESPADSMPARWKSGGLWRPGALVLTPRRIWFMPAAWDAEPWSIAHDDVERVETKPPALARLLPVRNWPNLLCFTARAGDHASLAVADPDAILAWFAPPRSPDAVPPGPRAAPKESSMPDRPTVLIADFLDETSIESAVLGDVAELVMAMATDESQLATHLPRADAIIVFHDLSILGEASFALAPRCRGVVRAGVGYNNIDLEAATRHDVVVCNVPDYGTEEVADHAIMFLLALVRKLLPSHSAIRAGTWDYRTAMGAPRLRGKTFGVVGCGRIGTATALRAKAMGLDVVFYDPYLRQGMDKALGIRRVYQLDELLEQSHFVSLHCYLDADTRHLINARTIARMRKGAILINTRAARSWMRPRCWTPSTRATSPRRGSTSSSASRSTTHDCRSTRMSCSPRTRRSTASRATPSCEPRPPRRSAASSWTSRRGTR